jgi:hypothetical protein
MSNDVNSNASSSLCSEFWHWRCSGSQKEARIFASEPSWSVVLPLKSQFTNSKLAVPAISCELFFQKAVEYDPGILWSCACGTSTRLKKVLSRNKWGLWGKNSGQPAALFRRIPYNLSSFSCSLKWFWVRFLFQIVSRFLLSTFTGLLAVKTRGVNSTGPSVNCPYFPSGGIRYFAFFGVCARRKKTRPVEGVVELATLMASLQ